MIKFNKYRYPCIVMYRKIKEFSAIFPQHHMLILSHVRAFDRTMKQYNKTKNVKNSSIDLAYRLSENFIERGNLSKKDLITYLRRIGTCHSLDYHAYELFFAFLILHAIKKLYHQENTDDLLQLLRYLEVLDTESLMPSACEDERALLTDRDYANMTRESKKIYRENIIKIARKEGETPSKVIENALKKAKKDGKHIGFYLKTNKNTLKKWIYFIFLWGSTIIMSIQLYLITRNLWLSLLAWIPSYMTSKIFTNHFISSFLKPHKFMRLKADCRSVQQTKTCVAIYDLLKDNTDILLQKLEMTYQQNQNVNAVFGLLLDLPDSNKKFEAGEKARIADIQAKIDVLNSKYKNSFFVCIRKRTLNVQEERYICEGHKNGAIDMFIRSMGSSNRRIIMVGVDVKHSDYLLVLDADTETQEGTILELICVACHPINRPIYDASKNKIIHGYGILVPKVLYKHSVLNTKMHNQFNQILYGHDSFEGIGLIHINSYKQIISHTPVIKYDGVKGDLLRCGYILDIAFVKHNPVNIASTLTYEYHYGKDSFLSFHHVKQSGITILGRYMLFERCTDMLTPLFSFVIIFLAALFAREHFLLYGITACMPYFAPTYKRLIYQILTGSTRSDLSKNGDKNIIIIIKSLQRSLWKFFLIPYRALNMIHVIRKGKSNPPVKADIFSFYPFVFGIILNLALGIYFLFEFQWQSILFFVWAVVPAMIFIMFHNKQDIVIGKKKNISL